MNETQPEPVQAPVTQPIPQIPKRKWYKMSPETKDTLWEIKWLLCTFFTVAFSQILQPLLTEIMESEMKTIWKTYSSILLPILIITIVGMINRIAQGKRQNHISQQMQQPQGMGIQQQLQGYGQQGMQYAQQGVQVGQQYVQQGAQYGQNLIGTGATQLQGVVQQIPQQIPPAPTVQVAIQPAPTPGTTTATTPDTEPQP
jgi:hypothetical protein